jgi:hypothetical protein
MPIVSGDITEHGAVIPVFVGVSRHRRERLLSAGRSVPPEVGVRVLLDTGSHISGLTPAVFTALGIDPIKLGYVLTSSTKADEPFLCKF